MLHSPLRRKIIPLSVETRRPKHSCEHEYLSYRPVAIESKHHAIKIDEEHESLEIIE